MKHNIPLYLIGFLFAGVFIVACSSENSSSDKTTNSVSTEPVIDKKPVIVPVFNADSAYSYIEKQVDFGPRIPGTPEHLACADWLENKFASFGFDVTVQKGVATTFDNKRYDLYNIIASYNITSPERILLCAHWDTRPFADRDEGANKNQKFDGANDGGSGVGVLLEVARQISTADPGIGVDIILFDLEDYGDSETEDSWCLGSQYWAKNLHKPGYYARYGILLDMVGAKDATFPMEGTSRYFASGIVDKVWRKAKLLGYGNMFVNKESKPTTDDHLYVNRDANIPCIDIVHYDVLKSDYFPHHHRVSDNMDNISKETLGAVGQVVLQVVFEEGAGI
jgi:Zn-dependent M28 family amino/carboxypeptidase